MLNYPLLVIAGRKEKKKHYLGFQIYFFPFLLTDLLIVIVSMSQFDQFICWWYCRQADATESLITLSHRGMIFFWTNIYVSEFQDLFTFEVPAWLRTIISCQKYIFLFSGKSGGGMFVVSTVSIYSVACLPS